MRAMGIIDACKNIPIDAITTLTSLTAERAGDGRHGITESKSALRGARLEQESRDSVFVAKLLDPPIKPHFKPIDYVETLAEIHEELENATDQHKSRLCLEQSFVFRGLGEMKLLRRSLRSARTHAATMHEKLVFSAWLKYERRGEDFDDGSFEISATRTSNLSSGSTSYTLLDDSLESSTDDAEPEACSTSRCIDDVIFHISGEKVCCSRQLMAALSPPFHTMLNGCFTESRVADIEFSKNGISAMGMKVVDTFSRTGKLGRPSPSVMLEVLAFANKFFCEGMKDACDQALGLLVHTLQDAVTYISFGLQENAQTLVATCLQVFLRELPGSLHNVQVAKLFCKADSRKQLVSVGHSSFALYSLLSQVAIEDDIGSDLCVNLLQRLRECASSRRQKALALHQLGCVMFARKQYTDAHELFEAAADNGHIYSLAGAARVKYKHGNRLGAYTELANIISRYKPSGWMFQERSLYSTGTEKLEDLNKATELDPTLLYPYKYRAAALMDVGKVHEAIAEINHVLGFRVTPECLELRIYFNIALQDYVGAVRDLRALLTLDPSYMIYSGCIDAQQLLKLLDQRVEQWTKADCWMQLYDRWSSVDDIGSLAVVHKMLESDTGKGLLYFRQSLLLLRLACPKAAMRSLRLAREHASSEHERLVYEGWILYDTGHRQEALKKAEESIAIQRSFEAFFLKAYALADTSLDRESSAKVIGLLEEALKCPSDGLRKGQALSNLGSVYVDCEKYDLAADCYMNALKIRHTRAHQGLARVYFLQGERRNAYEEMTKLIEKACNSASAYEKRSEYCERDLVMADLSMVTQVDPLRTYPYRYRAAVSMDNHREREAIAELSKAIAFKADLQLLYLRAAFHDCIGDLPAALRDCRAALSIDPNHQDTVELLSRVHSRL